MLSIAERADAVVLGQWLLALGERADMLLVRQRLLATGEAAFRVDSRDDPPRLLLGSSWAQLTSPSLDLAILARRVMCGARISVVAQVEDGADIVAQVAEKRVVAVRGRPLPSAPLTVWPLLMREGDSVPAVSRPGEVRPSPHEAEVDGCEKSLYRRGA